MIRWTSCRIIVMTPRQNCSPSIPIQAHRPFRRVGWAFLDSVIPHPIELWIWMSNWFATATQFIRCFQWSITSFKLVSWPRPGASRTRDWVSVANPQRGRSTLPVPTDPCAALLPPPSMSCPVISVALNATPYEPVTVLPPSSPPRRALCRPLVHWCHVQHSAGL